MRSPCSHRAAKAGGLAQNSTYKCSGDPGWAIGVAFLATAVGGPVNQNRGGASVGINLLLLFGAWQTGTRDGTVVTPALLGLHC